MMAAAEQRRFLDRGRSVQLRFALVMAVAPSRRSIASGPHAMLVARLQRPPRLGREQPLTAAEVDHYALAVEHQTAQRGAAADQPFDRLSREQAAPLGPRRPRAGG